ncbi:hypothetical protein BDV96DRAFT_134007 [Lophiotrema nucula]|uniref:Uncharacterized protein n=1 Tax=Lophiotrema nucula TaxID=690887 RepID=A0A6A5ZSV2_9PLEO|nr:hypothetical protein BDV96DRAFT_134007 [Lophiotrema nucula]
MADVGLKEEKRGLRQAIRKWREKRKAKKATTTVTVTSIATTMSPQSTSNAAPVPAPAALFAPTTETTIHSPADPRNRRASPPSTIKKPRNTRRNTAPANFWAQPGPTTTITTTANTSPDFAATTNRLRSRLSLRRFSSQHLSQVQPQSQSQTLHPVRPILSQTPSAPAPHDHQNRRATLQSTTASEIAAQTQHDAAKLVAAAEVIRRDKPKDWLDPEWRAKEAKIIEDASVGEVREGGEGEKVGS